MTREITTRVCVAHDQLIEQMKHLRSELAAVRKKLWWLLLACTLASAGGASVDRVASALLAPQAIAPKVAQP